jgi:RimJ/RimL family protein N-acetyltransferase
LILSPYFTAFAAADRDVRGQRYGQEALSAVCHMAHQHPGIRDLGAACEATNVASQRWLTACGFNPALGPAHVELADGRKVDSLWWRRTDATARRPCRVRHKFPGG